MVDQNAPVTETITVNMVVSENSKQSVVRGTFAIPDPKPNVEQIISTEKTATIKKTTLLPGKVVVDGLLTLQVIYVAFKPDQSVHSMHGQIPFTAFVDLPEALPGMNVKVDVFIEDVKLTPNKRDFRKFDVTAVLDVVAKVTEPRDVEILVEVPEGVEATFDTIHLDDVVGRGTSQVIVSDQFDEPHEKPEPKKIIAVDAEVNITESRVVADKVIVDGELTLWVMYVGFVPEQTVHTIHHTTAFTDFIEVPGARTDMDVVVDAMVEDCNVEIVGDPFFRSDCVVKLEARVTEPREIRVVTECDGAAVNTVELNVEQVIGTATSQVVVRESFTTPEAKPCPERIINVAIDKIKVTETKVVKDKVITRGHVDIKVVYESDRPNQAVHAMHQQLNFRTFVEIPGAVEGMDVTVKPMVEYINAEAKVCDVNVEAVIKVAVRVVETMRRSVCSGVEIEEPEEPEEPEVCVPGEIISYVIKPGDTFFTLASQFSTTVSAIQQANPGVDPNNLRVGQVIQIPCGAAG